LAIEIAGNKTASKISRQKDDSGFDFSLYGNREAERVFPQEKPTLHHAGDVNK
jgi:hypothetical protein